MNSRPAKFAQARPPTESPLRDFGGDHPVADAADRGREQRGNAGRRLVRQIASIPSSRHIRWTVTEGMQALSSVDQPQQPVSSTGNPRLHQVVGQLSVRVAGLSSVSAGHGARAFLKDIAMTYSKHYSTVVLVGRSSSS